MKLSQKLEHRQIISQRLQQSLRLLTLSNLEIEAAIEEELEVNPVLEWEPSRTGAAEAGTPADRVENIDWQSFFEASSPGGYFSEADGDEDFDRFATAAGPEVSLTEHLLRQLEAWGAEGREFEVAEGIISSLSRDGYLRTKAAALAEELGVKPAEVERVLVDIVQRFDPPGVGARDLREALYIQWRDAGDDAPPLAGVIIGKHLNALASKTTDELAVLLDAPPEEVDLAVKFILALEPRPGRAFGSEANPVLVPDIRVRLVDDEVEITLLDDRVGRLYISPRYRELLANVGGQDEEAARFVKQRLTAAASFIRAINQRRRTIEKVVTAIFEHQRAFLEVGEPGLKPLTMEDIADRVGFHVSTVSRAVASKVADTPTGVFPMKHFFTGKVAGSAGEVSVGKVKSLLQDVIDDEDKAAPLSDEELAAELSRRGANVARRTVAKYRKELRIPGKHERKKRI
jgi:RNA polymerase sigma-54 factor